MVTLGERPRWPRAARQARLRILAASPGTPRRTAGAHRSGGRMNTVKVKVDLRRVHIPALSTIGYGYGRLEDGTSAVIIADRREMEGIGRAIGEGKPPIVVYAEVVATGEIADGIAEQWHDQWAISDTESDLDQSLPAPEDPGARAFVGRAPRDRGRQGARRGEGGARSCMVKVRGGPGPSSGRHQPDDSGTPASRCSGDGGRGGHPRQGADLGRCLPGLSVGCALPASPRHGPFSPDRRLHLRDLSLRLPAGTGPAPTAEARLGGHRAARPPTACHTSQPRAGHPSSTSWRSVSTPIANVVRRVRA